MSSPAQRRIDAYRRKAHRARVRVGKRTGTKGLEARTRVSDDAFTRLVEARDEVRVIVGRMLLGGKWLEAALLWTVYIQGVPAGELGKMRVHRAREVARRFATSSS